ncbi:MAG: C40 family peptidase [Micrococcales bacterium]
MSPRHRSDVEINVLEQIELRSRRQIRDAERKPSRKDLREAKKKARHDAEVQRLIQDSLEATNPSARSVVRNTGANRKSKLRQSLTMLTSAGIFTTVALPAYAFSPQEAAMAQFVTSNAYAVSMDPKTQGLTITNLAIQKFDRIKIQQTTKSNLERQLLLNRYSSYRGPSAADFVKNPPFSKIDGESVLKVARKYIGVPYVFGGENPGGFDCSGYVRFVFAQFGLDLPHSVHAQARMGIIIHKEDALPGDIVVLNDLSHDGIYAGTGMFLHAPRPGDTVKLAPIYTNEYFIVRLKTN